MILPVAHFSGGLACAYAPPGSILKMRTGCQPLAGPGSSGDTGRELRLPTTQNTHVAAESALLRPMARRSQATSWEGSRGPVTGAGALCDHVIASPRSSPPGMPTHPNSGAGWGVG